MFTKFSIVILFIFFFICFFADSKKPESIYYHGTVISYYGSNGCKIKLSDNTIITLDKERTTIGTKVICKFDYSTFCIIEVEK